MSTLHGPVVPVVPLILTVANREVLKGVRFIKVAQTEALVSLSCSFSPGFRLKGFYGYCFWGLSTGNHVNCHVL